MTARQTARRPAPRRGATVVEAALLLSIFFMFLFGIFEYCRYLLVLQSASNAARDGARYAVVSSTNTNASTFTTDTTAASGYSSTAPGFNVPFITTYTTQRMGGVDGMISGFTVRVYPCNTASLYATPPVITPKTQPTSTNTVVSWNNAAFTERVAVRITGNYTPILPNFLFMSNPLAIDIKGVMGSEG